MGPIWLQRYPGDLEMIDVTGRPYFAIINRSRCAYASGILALGNDGRLLWQTPTGSYVTGMAANNSTIFYGTKNGGLAAMDRNIAAGFAILAAAYVFMRFLPLRHRVKGPEQAGTEREPQRGPATDKGTTRQHHAGDYLGSWT